MRSRCRISSLNFKSCNKTLAREVIANARQIHLIALMILIKSIVRTRRSNDVRAILFRDLRLGVLRHRPTAGLQTKFNISSKNAITFINNTPRVKQVCFSQQSVSLVGCKQHELLRLEADNNERVSSSPGRPRADLAQLTSNATPITARPAASPQEIPRLQNTPNTPQRRPKKKSGLSLRAAQRRMLVTERDCSLLPTLILTADSILETGTVSDAP